MYFRSNRRLARGEPPLATTSHINDTTGTSGIPFASCATIRAQYSIYLPGSLPGGMY